MTTVDQRVVEMRFDNKQFESGVNKTLSSLNSLKEGLKLKNANQGMKELDKTAKGLSFDPMAKGVQSIADRFTNLGIVGMSVLQNLTNRAMYAGEQIVKSLTIKPIEMGFREYETQINAVQTILANTESKGTTLDNVSAALDELNHYADQTIYNFTEMTRNIGTFTAAGVDLDTSVSAIKGIANLAAVSGSNSMQASMAMYQLSQALAAGTVKLIDWNSVVNAGMGGQVFQDALKETARVHGVAIDDMIKKEGSFRETLQHGWLSSEILTETLSKFTGDLTEEQLKQMGYTEEQIAGIIKMGQTANDAATKVKTVTQLFDTLGEAMQSGWTQSWEIVLGDFEEAKELLTGVSDVLSAMVNDSAKARNAILQTWKDLGGRTALVEALKNSFTALIGVLKPIKDAFGEVFPAPTGEALANLSSKLRDLTSGFENMTQVSSRIKATFKGIFTLFQPLTVIAQALVKSLGDLFVSASSAGDGLLRLTSIIGSKLSNSIGQIMALDTTVYNIKNVFDALFSVLRLGGAVIGTVASAIGTLLEKLFTETDGTSGLFNFLQTISRNSVEFTQSVDGMIEKINEFSSSLNETISNSKGVSAFISVVSGLLGGLGNVFLSLTTGVKELVRGGIGQLSSIFSKLGESMSGIFDVVSSGFAEFMQTLDFSRVLNMLNTGLITGVLALIAKFVFGLKESVEEFNFLDNIKDIFGSLKDGLEDLQMSIRAATLIQIAGALAILAISLAVLASIDPERLAMALAGLSVLFLELFGSMIIFSEAMDAKGFGSIFRVTSAMISLSVAVLILTAAIKNLSSLSWEELARGLGGVGVALAALAIFTNYVDFDKFKTRGAVGLIALAAAINLLGVAVEKFASMSLGGAIKGLAMVGVLLTTLGVFVNKTGEASKVMSTSAGLLILSVAMNAFALAIERMGNMSIEQIAKGLITMAGALLIIEEAMWLMPKNMLLTAPALVAVAAALVVLSAALQNMGGMSAEGIAKSLVALGGALGIIATAMTFMKMALPGAAALLVIAAALTVLAPVLMLFGTMSLEQIGSSLLMLAGTFAVLGVAGYALTPVVPTLLGLGAAIALIGVGCLAAGLGVSALAMGLMVLAGAGAAGIATLTSVMMSLIELVPAVMEKIGEGLVRIVKSIGESSGEIVESVSTLIHAIVDKVKEDVPYLVEAGFEIIKGLLQGISDNIGEIVIIAGDIIVNFLNGLAVKVPEIIQAGINLMIAFINGLADGIRNNQEQFRLALENLFDAVLTSALDFIKGMIGDFLERGKELIMGFIDGLKQKGEEAIDYIKGIPGRCLEKVTGWFNSFFSAGQDMARGLAAGIRDGAAGAIGAAADMAISTFENAKAKLGINSPSKKFMWIGMGIDEGMALGIEKYARLANNASTALGDSVVQNATKSLSGLENAVAGDLKSSMSVTPVINASSLSQTRLGLLNDFKNIPREVKVDANSDIMKSIRDENNLNNLKMTNAIDELRASVETLASKPSPELAMYVDSRKLASSIAKPMNQQLGVISRRGEI